MSLRAAFRERYAAEPAVHAAPGRVNLIGEHTDYNDGFVMPAAIGLQTRAAIAPRGDRSLHVASLNQGDAAILQLDDLPARPSGKWHDYVAGVAVALRQAGVPLSGADLLIEGNVPIGAGLSSSASLEVACARALLGVAGHALPPVEIARLCQRAENEFVGMKCGIMDQFAAVFGKTGQALLLDCRSLAVRALPLPENVSLAICNSGVRHALAGGEYNARRADCEEGVRLLSEVLPDIAALRDVTARQLDDLGARLPPRVLRRCRHVVGENARVLEAAGALERGDCRRFGALLYASHASLRDDYEVSCPELDLLVERAAGVEGVYGARMTGGGFGGCTVNLVRTDRVSAFTRAVSQAYERATGRSPAVYICEADGAGGVEE